MSKHMTKTQWKDALRLIKKRIVSFISIILVTAIGYSVFLACFFGHSAVQETIVETFDKYNYRDLNIVSTKGFSEDDVTSLKTIQGLSDIEGLCSADMHISHNNEAITATISSKTNSIGQYILKEGREIESTNECIVSYNTLKLLDLSLGDTIEIIDTKDIHLTQHTFVITGTCVPLDDFKTNNSLIVNIFVKNDVFNHPDNLFDYTNIYLTCTTDEKIAFSDEYKTIIKYITSNIEDVAEKRTVIRDDTLLIEGRDQISDAEIKLANGKSEIEKGKIEIQENESKLLEANIQLQIAQAKLDIYKQQLDSSEKEINAGQEKLEKAEKELADAKKQLNDARIQLDNAYILIENGKTQIKENEELLAQAKEKLDEGEVQLSMLEAVLSASSAVMELDISSLSQQLYELLSANWDPDWPSLDIDIFSLALYTNQLKTTLEDTIYSVISDAGVILSGADLSNFISNLASSPMWSTLIDSYNSLIEAKNLYAQLKEQYDTGISELEILKSQLADYENSVNNYIALLNFALYMVDLDKETLSKNLYDLLLSYWDNTWPELQMSTINLVLSAYQLGDSIEGLIGNITSSAGVNLSTTELNDFINNLYSSVSWQVVAYSYELLAQAASAYNEVYDSYNQAVLLYENAKTVFESETSRLDNLYQTITSSLSVIEFDEAQLVSQIYTLLSTYWDPSWPSLEMTMLYAAMYSYQIKNTLENTIYNMISALGVNLSRSEFEDFISNLKIEDIYPTLESSFNALIEAKEAYNNLKEQYNQGLRELELIKNQILSNEITVSIISSLMQSASNLANFDISNLSEIVYNLLSSQWDNAWPELQMDVINVVLSAYQFKSSVDDMIEKVLEASGVNLDSSELEDYINTLSSTLMYSTMQTAYDLIAKAQSVYDDLNQKYTLAVFMYDLAKAQLEQSENKLETLYQILSVSASVIGFDEAKLVSQIYDFISSFWNKSWPKIDMALLTLTSYANQFASSLEQTILNILESSGVLLSQADFTEYISRLKTSLLWNTIESTHSLISQAKDTYNGLCEQYAQGMTEWKAGKIQYENGKSEIEKAKTQLEYGIKQANDGEIQYQIGLQLYNVNLATYNSSLTEFEEGKETFLKAKEELENGQKELDSKKAEYDDGIRQLAEGKAKLAEAELEYEEGVEKIADGKRELSLYMPCKWVVSNRDNYKDYVELKTITETIYVIGFSFAGLFSLLSLLVCYSTISKIISEQEKLLGTFKALGFTSGEIVRKFLVFGSFATVSGGLVGIGVSFFLQEVLMVSVNNLFELGGNKLYASVLPMIVLIAICVLVGAFAAYASCKKMLSRSSLSLLSGEQQVNLSAHKTNAKSRKPRSLYAGLIWRNIKSDLNRVMITIACLAGCTMLIIIGFSYKASYTYIQEYDYEIFRKFDAYVSVDTSKNDSSSKNIQDIFEKYEMKYLPMYQFDTMFVIGEETQGETLCCVDPKKASNFFYVYDITKNKETPVPNVGVTINRRLSESFNLAIGDYIQIIDANGNAVDVPVTGIFELYATPTVLMSYEYAKTIFGELNVNYNMYAVYHHEENVDEVLVELESKEYFNSYNTLYGMKQNLQSTINITNVLVVIMIVMSGIMAFVVLLNLNRIQINQKRKELLVMRINGFTFRETANYLLRENISTTIIGIVLGIIIGIVMSYINMRLTETAAIQMMRQPSVLACVIAAGTTFLFSIIIQAISLHSIKKMKLTEV